MSRLPHKILFEEDSHAHDQSFWEAIVDALLERQRVRKDIDEDTITGLVNVFGSYLGECIIQCYGGTWEHEENTWTVRWLPDGSHLSYRYNKGIHVV